MEKGGCRADSPIKIFDVKSFVGRMSAVVRTSPAQEQDVLLSEMFLDQVDDGN
jgi:hypothetical protein